MRDLDDMIRTLAEAAGLDLAQVDGETAKAGMRYDQAHYDDPRGWKDPRAVGSAASLAPA
jgi:hypothetical protein